MRRTIPLLIVLALAVTGCDDKKKTEDDASEDDDSSKKKKKKGKNFRKYHSEALNAVGAISRGAAAAFEREVAASEGLEEGSEHTAASHALCKSAEPVPAAIPTGGKGYKPKSDDDFETGDSTTGWRCLKFALTQPIHCQYTYVAGKGFKSTKRGNKAIPDKAMHDDQALAYEAAAECDFDGDGETSLYAATGTVDPKTMRLKRATQIFIDKEGE